MNIRMKLALFFIAGIGAAVLFSMRFGQNIRNGGLLNFIGVPTIIVVGACHGIAFLIRYFLVRRRCRSLGIHRVGQTRMPDLSIAGEPLFSMIRKGYLKVAGLFFLLTLGLAGAANYLLYSIKDIPNEAFEPHLMQYWTMLASFALAMIMLFFALHFLLMSFLLEYKSKVKALLATVVSFMIVFLSMVRFS